VKAKRPPSADDPEEPPPIQDRSDSGGLGSAAGPLIALALIGVMLLHACMAPRLETSAGATPAGVVAPR
jgi:hypothetical protein